MLTVNNYSSSSYALVDITFLYDKIVNFARKISIAGIEESNKVVQYEYKYLYPTSKADQNERFTTNGNAYNDNITENVARKLNKFNVVLVNGQDKKDFLLQYIKCKSKVYNISNLIDQDEYTTNCKNSAEE